MNDIKDRLKMAMKHFDVTPNAFAIKAKIDPSNFAKMMDGKQNISKKTLEKIISAHGLSLEWIKNGVGEMIDTSNKGIFESPESIYAEDSEVIVGDNAVLKERIKSLSTLLREKDERIAELKEQIQELKERIEELKRTK